MDSRIIVNGREYESVDAMPADVRQMYEDALNPSQATYLGQFAYFTNLDSSSGWVAFTSNSLAVGSWAGQMVDLDMWAITDFSNITNFYFDNLSLTAFVCP